VVLEAVAIGLLGILVAGLLRSHAEILRQLHRLGADLDPSHAPVNTPTRTANWDGDVDAISGTTPDGDAVALSVDRRGERTLLLFLTTSCGTCARWWDGIDAGEHERALPGVRVVVVGRDLIEEPPRNANVPVVLASPEWARFGVPGSPYGVLIEGGKVLGQGAAISWAQLGSLIGRHLDDAARARGADDAAREQRADEELLAAGIRPGDPSLYRQ
jgi:hypothetical protein